MKVCTDSCLFGAWVANEIETDNQIQNILDIGTGTGLLTLMLAQKSNAAIAAIEINAGAALQAEENFLASNWGKRLTVLPIPVQQFSTAQKFDLIICNPPFFENNLLSPESGKNIAKHQGLLNLSDLFLYISQLLSENGIAAILIPYVLNKKTNQLANANNLFCCKEVNVKQTNRHGYFRSMQMFSRKKNEADIKQMSIKDENGTYTPEFVHLLKAYYLYL